MRELTIIYDDEYDYVKYDKGQGDIVLLMLPTCDVDFHSVNQELLGDVTRSQAKKILYRHLYNDVKLVRKEKEDV